MLVCRGPPRRHRQTPPALRLPPVSMNLLLRSLFAGLALAAAGLVAQPTPPADAAMPPPKLLRSAGPIGPEGGTLVSPDGSVEVAWDPNPRRTPTDARVFILAYNSGRAFQVSGPPGPATITCWPPNSGSPGTGGAPGPGPDPVKSAEPVVEIVDGNGEWIEVDAPPQKGGARKIRLADDLAPIDATGGVRPLFEVTPKNLVVRLGESVDLRLQPFNPPTDVPPWDDPTSEDYVAPITPVKPGADPSQDDFLSPIAPKKSASGSSAKPASATATATDRIITDRLIDQLRRTQQRRADVKHWQVFHVPGGNAELGTVDAGLAGPGGSGIKESVTYTAPQTMPESIRANGKVAQVSAVVRNGKTLRTFGAPVRVLEAGEVTLEFHCTLSFRLNEKVTHAPGGIQQTDSRDYTERFAVSGFAVVKMSEMKAEAGRPARVLFLRDGSAPMSLQFHATLERIDAKDEKGPGEYGERGETKTESSSAHGVADLPAPSFIYDPATQRWEVNLPVASWFWAARQHATTSVRTVFRPSGEPRFSEGNNLAWIISRLLAATPTTGTSAGTSDRMWSGQIDHDDHGARLHATWTLK